MEISTAHIRSIVHARTTLARSQVAGSWRRQPLLATLVGDLQAAGQRQATVLVGPRRAGKTWLLQQAMSEVEALGATTWFCDFTDPRLRGASMRQVLDALDVRPDSPRATRVFFDEVHFVDGWARELATLVNEGRARMAIADSAAAMLQQELAAVGVGRILRLPVAPLSFPETLAFRGQDRAVDSRVATAWLLAVDGYLERGGFPDAVVGSPDLTLVHRLLREQVVLQAIERDVSRVVGLREPASLERLATWLVAESGREAKWAEMERAAGATNPTVRKWHAALLDSGLLWTLERWHARGHKAARWTPKIYAADCGLVAACSSRCLPRSDTDLRARLFETAVANALRSVAVAEGARLSYWRSKGGSTGRGGGEIDFVVELAEGVSVVEVTSSRSAKGKVKALVDRGAHVGATRRVVVCDGTAEQVRDGVAIVPLWRFLLHPETYLR